jgi:hypothetical protein
MRSLFLVWVTFAVVSCSSADAPAVFIDIDYQIRCLECEPRSPDDAKRQIETLDDDMGYAVDCNVTGSGKNQVVSFSLSFDSDGVAKDHSIEAKEVPLGGGEPGSKCIVRVKEIANTYAGKCASDEPEPGAECRIETKLEGDVITGTVLCANMPNASIESSTRHLVLSEFGSMHEDLTPAEFELHGCAGL